MHVISDFPITKRWPPAYPDRLQLYSLPTPNGVKGTVPTELEASRSAATRISRAALRRGYLVAGFTAELAQCGGRFSPKSEH